MCIVFEDIIELQNKKFDFISFVESIFAFGGVTLGALMMPLLTWGTSNVGADKVADASSLLTFENLHRINSHPNVGHHGCRY